MQDNWKLLYCKNKPIITKPRTLECTPGSTVWRLQQNITDASLEQTMQELKLHASETVWFESILRITHTPNAYKITANNKEKKSKNFHVQADV